MREADESERVRRDKRAKLVALGLSPYVAKELAREGIDVHAVADLVKSGCPVKTAVKIVR